MSSFNDGNGCYGNPAIIIETDYGNIKFWGATPLSTNTGNIYVPQEGVYGVPASITGIENSTQFTVMFSNDADKTTWELVGTFLGDYMVNISSFTQVEQ